MATEAGSSVLSGPRGRTEVPAVDVLFVAPHYVRSRKEGTYDGVTKYSSELLAAIGRHPAHPRAQLSRLGPGYAYYLDALCGFAGRRAEAMLRRPQLVHTLDWYIPRISASIPHVVTVHDLIMLEWRQGGKKWKAELFLRGLRAADHYIAISGRVADALRGHLGIADERISVIHHGINPLFPAQPLPVDADKTIDILFVSNIAHRKNVMPLLRAVERLRAGGRMVRLVIVGRVLEEEAPVLDKLRELERSGALALCSGLSEQALAETYAKSRVFVSSSLAEGFGMPVLEAMATGLPLVLSDIPVYREIADGYATFFDPADDAALAQQLDALLRDAPRRGAEALRNRRRGDQFSWRQCAEATMAVYARLV
jgi:glycosyltransferase involved in cell wall biosynthesis